MCSFFYEKNKMNVFIKMPLNKRSVGNKSLVCGIGINDATYQVKPTIENKRQYCPFYTVWVDMLRRCYSKKHLNKRPTYLGCTVCNEWHTFSVFKTWMESQDWKDKFLDKDILIFGNKVYSPSTCLFVSNKVNTLLLDCNATKGAYKTGVSYYKANNKFRARCSDGFKCKHLGYFLSENEAYFAYLTFKIQIIILVANEQNCSTTKEALLNIALLFKSIKERI